MQIFTALWNSFRVNLNRDGINGLYIPNRNVLLSQKGNLLLGLIECHRKSGINRNLIPVPKKSTDPYNHVIKLEDLRFRQNYNRKCTNYNGSTAFDIVLM